MSKKEYTHFHRDSGMQPAYVVHHPDGNVIGYVQFVAVGTPMSLVPGVTSAGWVAYDENRTILTDGLETRYRASEWVSER